jgi:hypothetical protein
MNGKEAESTPAASTGANVRPAQRASAPHSRQTSAENARAATAMVATASTLIPTRAASG